MAFKLELMIWWATNFYRIKHQHLVGQHWYTCKGTALYLILKKEVPMWCKNKGTYDPRETLMFIGADGKTYLTTNGNIKMDISKESVYFFDIQPTPFYFEKDTNRIRNIIRMQRDYNIVYDGTRISRITYKYKSGC